MKYWRYQSGWRLLPGLLAAGLTFMTARTEIFRPIEHGIYRFLFQARGEQLWDERVTVIEIDEASLAAIGQFPWPRHRYVELLEKLEPANPSVIAFDILFAESTEDDADLSMAMARHGNVVLTTAWDEHRGVIGPNASVMEGAIATGHIHHNADADGITRTYRPKVNGISALSIAAVQRYSQQKLATGGISDVNQNLWLNWRGFVRSAPRYSFTDVLNGQVPASSFEDKIDFIGFTGADLDEMATPYNHASPTAGVYQHIVAANNLLAQDHLQLIIAPVWGMVLFLSPILGYTYFYCPLRVRLLGSLTATAIWAGVVFFAFNQNYWLPTMIPIMSFVSTSGFVILTEGLRGRLKFFRFTSSVRLGLHASIEQSSYSGPPIAAKPLSMLDR